MWLHVMSLTRREQLCECAWVSMFRRCLLHVTGAWWRDNSKAIQRQVMGGCQD